MGGSIQPRGAAEKIDAAQHQHVVNGREQRSAHKTCKKAEPQIGVNLRDEIRGLAGGRAERAHQPEEQHERHAERQPKGERHQPLRE